MAHRIPALRYKSTLDLRNISVHGRVRLHLAAAKHKSSGIRLGHISAMVFAELNLDPSCTENHPIGECGSGHCHQGLTAYSDSVPILAPRRQKRSAREYTMRHEMKSFGEGELGGAPRRRRARR